MASAALLSSVALAGTLLAYFRIPPLSARTVWAEDGALFLQEYLDQGPALLAPYSGYLHLLPRLIVAFVAPLFGLEAYAIAITVACSIVLGLIAALTFYCASELTASVAVRLGWASIPVLVAPGALETLGNVANLHWYLLWLAPWVLMKSPPALGQQILLGTASLIIALSEIQAVLFLPLVLWRWRDRRLWWAKTAFLAGAICQLASFWLFPRGQGGTGESGDAASVVYGYFLNSSAAIAYGSSAAIIDHVQTFGMAPIFLSAVPFAVVAVLLVLRSSRIQRMTGLIWILSSGAVWTAAVVINPAPYFHYSKFGAPGDWEDFLLSRYSTVPSMFLLALIPLLASVLPARPRHSPPDTPAALPLAALPKGLPLSSGLMGVFLVLQTVYFFPFDDVRSAGPEWSVGVNDARLACRADPILESINVPQAPAGWNTTLRCTDL